MADETILKQLVEYKERLRMTHAECAKYFGVSERTIIRWTQDTLYGRLRQEYKQNLREDARVRLSTLVDDIIMETVDILKNGKSEIARVSAARILGEWIGLDQPETTPPPDDRTEVINQLKSMMNQQPQITELPPPRPGGALPYTTAEFVIEDQQEGSVERSEVLGLEGREG